MMQKNCQRHGCCSCSCLESPGGKTIHAAYIKKAVAKFLVILSQKGPFGIPGLDSVKEQTPCPYCSLSPAGQMAGKALL
jgi:hypothetical protein